MNASGYRFDSFVVDFSAREFVRDGERIHLQEQPFQLLVMLLERSNQVVTREELRKRLWPANVLVDFDHRLNNAITRLREVLGDDADLPRFIETVPRVGYRFVYPLAAAPGSRVTAEQPSNGPAGPGLRFLPNLERRLRTPSWRCRSRTLVGWRASGLSSVHAS